MVLFYFQTYGDRYLCGVDKAVGDLPVSVRTCDKNGVRRPYTWLAPGVDEGFVVEGSEITTVEGQRGSSYFGFTSDASVVIVLMIIIITTENWRHLDEYSSLDEIFLNRIFGSEVVNFFIWFPKFLPLFLFLFPIHRAMWFQGGKECDYLKCKRSVFSYTRSYNYLDADFPRCVRPETSARCRGTCPTCRRRRVYRIFGGARRSCWT